MSTIEIDITPAYTLTYISSGSTSYNFESLETLALKLKEGNIILWQHHGVFAGEIAGGEISWAKRESIENDKSHIIRIRAFNPVKEYHIWRSGIYLKGRLRTDGGESINEPTPGETLIPFTDSEMVLRSVITKQVPEYSKIATRNYINRFDENNYQAGYEDSRFVQFI